MIKKCFRDVAGFDDRWVIITGLPLASMLISLLLFYDYYEQGNWPFLSVCIPMSFVYTGIFWFALRWTYHRVKSRYPDKTDATILLERDTPYDTLVQVMDRTRIVEVNAGLSTVQAELFPDVSIGDAPTLESIGGGKP